MFFLRVRNFYPRLREKTIRGEGLKINLPKAPYTLEPALTGTIIYEVCMRRLEQSNKSNYV